MGGYILRDKDQSVSLPAQRVDRLLSRGDGDAALLYLFLSRTDRGVTPEEIQERLHWTQLRFAAAERTLRQLGLLDGETWTPANGNIDMAFDYNAGTKSFYGNDVEMTYVDLTNVNENAQAFNFVVYPVPAQDEIHIEAEGFQKAEIYSLIGQKVMESLRDKMNVSALSSGLYVMKVYDRKGGCATQRFVVK